MSQSILLSVSHLRVDFLSKPSIVTVLDDLSFKIEGSEVLCLVGESGCGKSVTALAVMRLLGGNGRITCGEISLGGQNLVCLSEKELRKIRGSQIAMIFQNPLSSLNPVLPIGLQVSEALRIHRRFTCREARAAALELLKQVGIKEPVQAARQFPHAFSGGMRQRAMIAMALACQPKLLIADEPTTSLDVVSQAQILNIFQEIRRSSRASMLFITHDLGIAAEIADRVLVMYAGELVEQADIFTIFSRPAHPYTQVLFSCVPRRRGTKRLRVFESMVAENYVKLRGCRFFSRCPVSKRICQTTHPELTALSHGHLARCLYCR